MPSLARPSESTEVTNNTKGQGENTKPRRDRPSLTLILSVSSLRCFTFSFFHSFLGSFFVPSFLSSVFVFVRCSILTPFLNCSSSDKERRIYETTKSTKISNLVLKPHTSIHPTFYKSPQFSTVSTIYCGYIFVKLIFQILGCKSAFIFFTAFQMLNCQFTLLCLCLGTLHVCLGKNLPRHQDFFQHYDPCGEPPPQKKK